MSSTYSTNLGLELIGDGDQTNTWGTTTNVNLGTLLEQAITGIVSVDVTSGNVTLTALNGASDQARNMVINVTGSPGVARSVLCPDSKSKVYIVANNSDGDVTFRTVSHATPSVLVSAGTTKLIYCDGMYTWEGANAAETFTLGGDPVLPLEAATKQYVDDTVGISPVIASLREVKTAPSISAGTLTLNCANGNVFAVSMNANVTTLAFSNVPSSGEAYSLTLALTADGTQRTFAWGSSIKWASGGTPTLTYTPSGKVDIFVLTTWDGGTTWYAFTAGQNL